MRLVARVGLLLLVWAQLVTAQDRDQAPGESSVDDPRRPPSVTVEEDNRLIGKWDVLKGKYRLSLVPWAYVRVAYEAVDNDDRYDFIGRNDGFILDSVRTGFDAVWGDQLSMRISLEAATNVNEDINDPFGTVDVRLRDGYLRWDPFSFIGAQVGQFKAPFAAEELRSTSDLLFVSRAVGQEGVLAGRGFETDGLSVDRQLGAMLSPRAPIPLPADFGIAYYFMVSNGNQDNHLVNDNSKVAITGRVEGLYSKWITLGAAGLWNKRTVGELPNRYNEEDAAFATDLLVNPGDFEFFFQYVQFDTDFPTVGVQDRTQRAFHVQAGYRVRTPWFHVTPAYRFAYFDAWADNNDLPAALDNYELEYHTLGLRIGHNDLPLTLFINYTFTVEEAPNELENNRFQILVQVEF